MNAAARRTQWVAAGGVLAVVAYAAVSAMQVLVWNPLAAVPGNELAQTYVEMDAADEAMPVAVPVIVLGAGVVIAVMVGTLFVHQHTDAVVVAVAFLGMLAWGAPAFFVASFLPGMSVADAFGISGNTFAPGAVGLYAVSVVAFAAAVVMASRLVARRRVRPVVIT